MRKFSLSMVPVAFVVACSSSPQRQTLARLHDVPPDLAEIEVEDSLVLAMHSYRSFLEETPESEMTPEAMRRLADLQIENEFGIMGTGDIVELSAPPDSVPEASSFAVQPAEPLNLSGVGDLSESDEDFEARATGEYEIAFDDVSRDLPLPDGTQPVATSGATEAIRLYQRILTEYPFFERNDQVLYQMARAYDEVGLSDEAMAVMNRLVEDYGYSRYVDEVHFRRGEYLFTHRRFRDAETAFETIVDMAAGSPYYELALYKLGWSLYKQDIYELALHRFISLLDYKLSIGYDFGQGYEEDEERRVADTFRVISLSFSNIGGPDVIGEYFTSNGNRSYEDKVYSNLGEFYLSKLRYQDAAGVYSAFVELNPTHRISPRFSMRVTEIYGEGGFPILVVESKKDFATRYNLNAVYWNYFDPNESSEVLGFLKTNLIDLANHYHARYQDERLAEDQITNFSEASHWYREFLSSFPAESESPGINYQLADLLLEHEKFGEAAREYERTAYDYSPHHRADEAGYAAIYAHRQHLDVVGAENEYQAKRSMIGSSLRFADTFPEHEQVPTVLGAAAEDLYAMQDFQPAVASARMLIERYPAVDPSLLRAAWTVVAHGSFDQGFYSDAEQAYSRVLAFVPADDDARSALVDNLAASIYQQGEQSKTDADYRAAADHFLRIRDVAPSSEIRSSAEYDAAAALVHLEDWSAAGRVLEEFRATFPEHELEPEATKQLAAVYRQAGRLDRSAIEYERVASDAKDPELRREAMLLAGDLYEQAEQTDSALDVYVRYIGENSRPLDVAQETRFKVAEIYVGRENMELYHDMLRDIVAIDATAGIERTDRSRYLAAQSSLVLAEQLYDEFAEIELVQPFEERLAEKQRRMDVATSALEKLIDYEVGEVTAAATYYIAEVYFDFGQSLLHSERPVDLPADARADYELAIEEEAFPFEELAIEVHEQNYELIAGGLFNDWIQSSLDRLAEMMPGRYAKYEISSGFIGSIDTYAYRSPGTDQIDIEQRPSEEASSVSELSVSVAPQDLLDEEVASALVR